MSVRAGVLGGVDERSEATGIDERHAGQIDHSYRRRCRETSGELTGRRRVELARHHDDAGTGIDHGKTDQIRLHHGEDRHSGEDARAAGPDQQPDDDQGDAEQHLAT